MLDSTDISKKCDIVKNDNNSFTKIWIVTLFNVEYIFVY